jgi:hypothetical protein
MFYLCNILLAFLPGLIIIGLFLDSGEPVGIGYAVLICAIFIIFLILIGNVLHFIISIFTKHNIFIEDDKLTIQGKKILTQSVMLDDVKYVVFDHGEISKSSNTPCSINLYVNNRKQEISIKNPSFLLICYLNRRCKNAKFKFNNYKWYIIWSIVVIILSIFLCIIV